MFDTWGPFDCSLDDVDGLWINLRKSETLNLENGIGIYIVCSRDGGELIPWYVGQTRKQNFGGRLKQHFTKERFSSLRGKQLGVFLIGIATQGEPRTEAQERDEKYINFLEIQLIDASLKVNKGLLNRSEVAFLKSCWVAGFRGDGCHTGDQAATELARMLNTKDGSLHASNKVRG